MGIINDINSLTAPTMIKCNQFIGECAKEGITVSINETLRNDLTQLLYFIQGTLEDVAVKNPNIYIEFNNLRKKYKFWALSKPEADRRVTWTLNSAHFYGKAFDAVPLDSRGLPWWNAPDNIWETMAKCGERVGLYPGRKFSDNPHFEDRA